jgi:hypothetical protein
MFYRARDAMIADGALMKVWIGDRHRDLLDQVGDCCPNQPRYLLSVFDVAALNQASEAVEVAIGWRG